MQGIPRTFEEYILLAIIPQILLGLVVLFLWVQIGYTLIYITRGIQSDLECSARKRLERRLFESYLSHPVKWKVGLRVEFLVSWILAGITVGWNYTGTVYLPPVVVLTMVGAILLNWYPLFPEISDNEHLVLPKSKIV